MKILFVADLFPWPVNKGGHLRVSTAIEGLMRLGEVDLFSLFDTRGAEPVVPEGIRLRRFEPSPYPSDSKSNRWKLEWPIRRGVPLPVAMRAGDQWPRRLFTSFADDRYDLVWFSTAATWAWMGRPRLGPTVIDLIDLEDMKERQKLGQIRRQRVRGTSTLAHRRALEAKTRLNIYDWTRLQKAAATAADCVVVSSPEDLARLKVANAVVIPNTYPQPAVPVGKASPEDPPTVMFQGSFDYPPNSDAAAWLVREIAPQLRQRLPGTRIRLVGQETAGVRALADEPDVTVTGLVPSMESELARADVVLVPLRMGSGTRLKILESFAHRVPVVSTTIGAEGIGAIDGVHLLIADTPGAMVEACQRLQSDPELRGRLVDEGQALFSNRFSQAAVAAPLRNLVDGLTRGRG